MDNYFEYVSDIIFDSKIDSLLQNTVSPCSCAHHQQPPGVHPGIPILHPDLHLHWLCCHHCHLHEGWCYCGTPEGWTVDGFWWGHLPTGTNCDQQGSIHLSECAYHQPATGQHCRQLLHLQCSEYSRNVSSIRILTNYG